ncbi:ATP-binding protein [Alteromonas aestuariivivens]|nr:ATP-binding protein [Alteromonas aestuariivivens]
MTRYTGLTSHLVCALIVWLSAVPWCASQNFPATGKTMVGGHPTGIVRDIETVGDTVFLGAENGLFQITGATIRVFDHANSPLGQGYISSLRSDQDGNLWIAEFGGGVFVLPNHTSEILRADIAHPYIHYAVALAMVGNRLVISFGTGLILYNPSEQKVERVYTQISDNPIAHLSQIEAVSENELAFVQNQQLIIFNLQKGNVRALDSETHFSKLSRLSSLVSSGDTIYLGGDTGVYRYERQSGLSRFFPFEDAAVFQQGVHRMIVDRSGSLWVAAGSLFRLDTTTNSLKEPAWLYPIIPRTDTQMVMALGETAHQELLFYAPLPGLVTVPALAESFNYITENREYFTDKVLSVLRAADDTITVVSEHLLYRMNQESGAIESRTPVTELPAAINAKCQRDLEYTFSLPEPAQRRLLPYCSSPHSFAMRYEQGNILVYDGKDFHVISGEGEQADQFAAPADVIHALYSSGRELYVVDAFGRLHVQRSKFSWNTVDDERLRTTAVNCLLEAQNKIWVCTSGKGLAYFEEQDLQLQFLDPSITGGSRYVRFAARDFKDHLWLATNRGLFVFEPSVQAAYPLNQLTGVLDTDFELNGVIPVGDQMLVLGDRMRYLFSASDVHRYLELRAKRISRIDVRLGHRTDVSSDKGGRELIYSSVMSDVPEIELAHGDNSLSFQITLTDFLYHSGQQIEYRMLGIEQEWTRFSGASLTVGFPPMGHGSYRFQARVLDPISKSEQPIVTVPIRIGAPFWLSWPAMAVYVLFALLTAWFAYRRYRYEAALRDIQLDGLVNDKQKALEESHASIKRLLEHKQRLFTNVSHELRTPLTLVTGPLQQIQDEPNSPDNPNRFQIIRRNVERLEGLVDQLMEIERFESIRLQPRQIYTVEQSLPQIINEIKPLADFKNHTVEFKLNGSGPIRLLVDSLEKIITNLFSNAVKYTPNGGTIQITAECHQLHLTMRIRDTGKGMSPEQLAVIFKRFTRLDNTADEQGSGVGLALVKELVMANGGWISVESEVGKGSCFCVNLPMFDFNSHKYARMLPNAPSEGGQENIARVHPDAEGPISKPVILIVEDNDEMRDYLKAILQKAYRCAVARNGVQALEVAGVLRPDLILTDCKMPQMNGIELATRIRKDPVLSHVPIIMLTALTNQTTQVESLRANIDCCLTKPVRPLELTLRIENLLQIRKKLMAQNGEVKTGKVPVVELGDTAEFGNDKEQAFYVKFVQLLEEHYADEAFSRAIAASALAVSERQLNRKLSVLFDYNFAEYLKRFRLHKSKPLLRKGGQITQVAFEVGFANHSYFSTCFREVYGVTPSQYQARYAAQQEENLQPL